MSAFQKAVKSKSKLRCAVFGPPGAGKTYSALAIASGLGGKIALIDSERLSASKYADRFEFDTVDLQRKNIDEYIRYIADAGKAGYDVLVIDSLSHGWQELLEQIDKLAAAKYKGNTWAAWSEGTPQQKKFIDAILSYPGHVIATMRSKIEYVTSKDERGKTDIKKAGMAPEQGKGIEYEFDLLVEINQEHYATITKDRTGKYQDQIIEKPGVEFGKELAAWLNSGSDRAKAPETFTAPTQPAPPAPPEPPAPAPIAPPANVDPSTGELFDGGNGTPVRPLDQQGNEMLHKLLDDPKSGLIAGLSRTTNVDMVAELKKWWHGKKAYMPYALHEYGLKIIGIREDELLGDMKKAG